MTDIVDRKTRSRMMAGIKGANTIPERRLRQALHALGLRFRLHVTGMPGRPDIVFPKFRAVCLVHGCFWHRHADCRFATTPATRADFWQSKFASNVERDQRQQLALLASAWRVATVWECAITGDNVEVAAAKLAEWLSGGDQLIEIGEPQPSAARPKR